MADRAGVRGNGSTVTQCQAFVVNSNNGSVTTPFVGVNTTTFTLITMGTLFLDVNSTGHVECDVAPAFTSGALDGGAVLSVGEP